MKTKYTALAAYLIFQGAEVPRMSKDDMGNTEFEFEDSEDLAQWAKEYPLSTYKRFMDIYKEVLGVIKGE